MFGSGPHLVGCACGEYEDAVDEWSASVLLGVAIGLPASRGVEDGQGC